MRYNTGTDTESKLVALLDAAQDEPVFIVRNQEEVAVLVSVKEYSRLRSSANLGFQEFCDTIADKAAAKGLTESRLEELLNHA